MGARLVSWEEACDIMGHDSVLAGVQQSAGWAGAQQQVGVGLIWQMSSAQLSPTATTSKETPKAIETAAFFMSFSIAPDDFCGKQIL